jgi:hypothetical protein
MTLLIQIFVPESIGSSKKVAECDNRKFSAFGRIITQFDTIMVKHLQEI